MKRFVLLLLAATSAAADGPTWASRWLWNPVERTARGIETFAAGNPEVAVKPLETALRLRPESPVARYNAGTARLAAGAGDAVALLESAAGGADADLAPRAQYNLGTARLAVDDLVGAVDAFQEALRKDPGMEDAKFNLELALRRLREEQGQGGESEGDQEQQGEPQKESRQQEQAQQEQQEQPEQQEQDSQQPPRESPLPRFRDLPDMSAEEAAAILQAIENLEREQRRRSAEEAAAASPGKTKDW